MPNNNKCLETCYITLHQIDDCCSIRFHIPVLLFLFSNKSCINRGVLLFLPPVFIPQIIYSNLVYFRSTRVLLFVFIVVSLFHVSHRLSCLTSAHPVRGSSQLVSAFFYPRAINKSSWLSSSYLVFRPMTSATYFLRLPNLN